MGLPELWCTSHSLLEERFLAGVGLVPAPAWPDFLASAEYTVFPLALLTRVYELSACLSNFVLARIATDPQQNDHIIPVEKKLQIAHCSGQAIMILCSIRT